MKLGSLTVLLLAAVKIMLSTACAQALPQLGKSPIDEVVAALTTEEKVSLVMGTGMNIPDLPPEFQAPASGSGESRVPGAAGTTFAVPRLGIPSMVLADGPAGLRIQPQREDNPDDTYYCTAFPIATLLASSWDIGLVERVGSAIGNEVKEYGVDVLLAPALNIHRIPLGGRNFEYFSEDPLLSGKMAAAIVNGVHSRGVGTTLKHFIANNHEWNRYTIDIIVDQRALREIYYKGFEIAVKESQPWAVMTSYNKTNGTYTSERRDLLSSILRDQWGFDGLVMSDWFAGRDAIAQMNAGNELLMPGTTAQHQALLNAIKTGELDESVLDRNIAKILQIVLKSPVFNNYRYSDKPELEGNARIARDAAAQGMVLLQNRDSVLPLPAGLKLGVFGNRSYEIVTGGTGSGNVNEAYSISLIQGLEMAGFAAHAEFEKSYTDYIASEKAEQPPPQRLRPLLPLPERDLSTDDISKIAAETDMALITIGRSSGEFADRKAEDDFYLSVVEKRLLVAVTEAYHEMGKKVVVVLNIGGAIETASWRDLADAILLAWQPGQEAGHAITDVLSGRVNPSGKLVTTFPISLHDFPSAKNFPGVVLEKADPDDPAAMFGAKAAEIVYQDGIWVGYRAFNTKKIKTAYPFGYGLSYTDFAYSNLTLSSGHLKDKLTASVTITNSGDVAGSEVVQLYVSAPHSSLDKPESELRAFDKTRLLQPQESQILTFDITNSDLVSFDPTSSMWVVEAGKYTIQVGASSTDIRVTKDFQKLKQSRLPL